MPSLWTLPLANPCHRPLPFSQGVEIKGKGVMQTYFYLGVGSGVGPASIRSSSVTGTTGSNHRATNDNMPPPSDAVGDPTTTADGDDASLVVKSTLERTSPRRISPLLAAAHQTTVPSFNPGLILMCQQAVAASEAAMRTATEAARKGIQYMAMLQARRGGN